MRIALLVLIAVLLGGCATTGTKLDVTNKRIGVDYRLNDKQVLCHIYRGVTVFGNKTIEYPIEKNISQLVSDGYKKGISETGNIPVGVKSEINWAKYMVFSSWDGSLKLNDEGKSKVKEVAEKDNLDYILIAKDLTPYLDERGCKGSSIVTSFKSIDFFTPVYVASIYDGKNGELVGDTFISNDHHRVAYQNITNKKELSDLEVESLINYSYFAAYKSIKQVLSIGEK